VKPDPEQNGRRFVLLAALGLGLFGPSATQAEFALRDGDTVVFLGDSITAARTYGKIVENYTLLRYPHRKVHFINAGWGGDTAAGGLKRLDRDVLAHGATLLIVAYGINDIGWGARADAEHKRIYLESIRGIVEQCKARGVRVYIASAAITAESPDGAEHGFLQTMCDEGMALARSLGEQSIDVERAMRTIQRKVLSANATSKPNEKATLHAADGIHLSDLGQLAMAFAILKGLGAPAEVSAAVVDARESKVISTTGCHVTNFTSRAGAGNYQIEFDRSDDGLPVNFGLFGALQFRFVPVPDELNRYMLTVTNLPAGRYEIVADGRELGTFTNGHLADGLNLSSATSNGWEPGGPWDAAASILIHITDARSQIAEAARALDYYLPAHRERVKLHAQMDELNNRIESLQSRLLNPRPFHFVVRRAAK
jgi:lysophospholipase L1-like esterase